MQSQINFFGTWRAKLVGEFQPDLEYIITIAQKLPTYISNDRVKHINCWLGFGGLEGQGQHMIYLFDSNGDSLNTHYPKEMRLMNKIIERA